MCLSVLVYNFYLEVKVSVPTPHPPDCDAARGVYGYDLNLHAWDCLRLFQDQPGWSQPSYLKKMGAKGAEFCPSSLSDQEILSRSPLGPGLCLPVLQH